MRGWSDAARRISAPLRCRLNFQHRGIKISTFRRQKPSEQLGNDGVGKSETQAQEQGHRSKAVADEIFILVAVTQSSRLSRLFCDFPRSSQHRPH